MKFSSFALAAVAIAASGANGFSAPKTVGRIAQVRIGHVLTNLFDDEKCAGIEDILWKAI